MVTMQKILRSNVSLSPVKFNGIAWVTHVCECWGHLRGCRCHVACRRRVIYGLESDTFEGLESDRDLKLLVATKDVMAVFREYADVINVK